MRLEIEGIEVPSIIFCLIEVIKTMEAEEPIVIKVKGVRPLKVNVVDFLLCNALRFIPIEQRNILSVVSGKE